MATLNTGTLNNISIFTGAYELTQSNGTTFHFNTANKYLDKDILLKATVQTSSITVNTSSTAANNEITWNNGWIDAGSIGSAAVTLSGSKASSTPTMSTVSSSVTGSTALAIDVSTTSPESGKFYIALRPEVAKTELTPTSTITSGFLGDISQISGSVTVSSKNGSIYYLPITPGTIDSNASGGSAIGTIARGKQIKIEAGYYNADKYYNVWNTSNTYEVTSSGIIDIGTYNAIHINNALQTFSGGTTAKIDYSTTPQLNAAIASVSTNNISNVSIVDASSDNNYYYTRLDINTNTINTFTQVTQSAVVKNTTAGFIGNENNVSVYSAHTFNPSVTINSASLIKYIKVNKAEAIINGSTNATPPTISTFSSSVSGKTQLDLTVSNSLSEEFYVAIRPTAPETIIPVTATINTFGYLGSTNELQISTIKANAKTGANYYVNIPKATLEYSGGNITNTSATINCTNVSYSSSDTSGIAITPLGKADRTAISYNNTYTGWINDLSGQVCSAITNSTWEGDTYYLTGVELTANHSFNITVPNGSNDKITFHFSVDNNGNTTIT